MCIGTFAIPPARAQSAGTYSEPVAYCRAYGDVDKPGPRYVGPQSPSWMFSALKLDPKVYPSDPERLFWRCMNGRVLACYVYNSPAGCEKVATGREPLASSREFCRSNPNSQMVPTFATGAATGYLWRCRGTVPVISGAITPDARGYFAGSYEDITAFGPSAPASARGTGRDASFTSVPPGYIARGPMPAAELRYIKAQCGWKQDSVHVSPTELRADFDGDGKSDTATILVQRSDPYKSGLRIVTSRSGLFFIPDRTQTGEWVVASQFLTLGRRGDLVSDPFSGNGREVRATASYVVASICGKSSSAHVFNPARRHFLNLWISD